jgi:hypothetical protein
LAAVVVITLALTIPSLRGDSFPIPASVQLLLFSKIWKFDRSLSDRDEIVLAILYQSSFRISAESKERLIEAVHTTGMKIRCIPVSLDNPDHVWAELQSSKADVFYITEMRGISISEVVRVSRAHHIKTITVVQGYVEGGVAIGLRVRNDKPDIVVNLSAAKAEGSDLTAQLLRFATIVTETTGQ